LEAPLRRGAETGRRREARGGSLARRVAPPESPRRGGTASPGARPRRGRRARRSPPRPTPPLGGEAPAGGPRSPTPPPPPALRPRLVGMVECRGADLLEAAPTGGEDYALLAGGPGRARPREARRIGRVETGREVYLETDDALLPAPEGFDHFPGLRHEGRPK